ncbi:hypothetical protein ACLB2K_027200 [Fragaria x ananassa]
MEVFCLVLLFCIFKSSPNLPKNRDLLYSGSNSETQKTIICISGFSPNASKKIVKSIFGRGGPVVGWGSDYESDVPHHPVLSRLKRRDLDDGVEMEETNESSLRFSDEKYHDIVISAEDEDCLFEDAVKDTLEIMEDPVILIEHEEVGRDKSDEHGNSKSVGADDITDETIFSSEWYAALKGKNMKLLRFEDEDVKDIIFNSLAETDKFYAYYAFVVGFSRRCFKHDKAVINGVECVRRRAWCCSKQGYEDSAAKKKRKKVYETDKLVTEEAANEKEEECEDATTLNKKKKKKMKTSLRGIKYSRIGCEAVFQVRLNRRTMEYEVVSFVPDHNHELAEPYERQFLRSCREVTMDDVRVVLALQMAQVLTSVAYEFIALQAGGLEFVGFMLKDLYNKLDEVKRNNMKRGDAESAINWLRMKGREEGHFFGRFTPDWERRLANLFWRASESLLDYNAFGDVVIIDTAIVADEKEATFTWVIEKFLQSMNNKHLITVLTDGYEVMRTVLKKLMPTTRHRLCAWHIGRNIGQNVKDVEVQKQLGKMLYASYTIDEWEEAWADIVAKHGLEEDPWITALYEKRDRWAEAFFRGNFCAGMCSTQRCEGINETVYLLDDYKSKNHKRKFDSHLKLIEEDAFNTFTNDIFVVIKGQIILKNRFSVRSCVQFGGSEDLMFYLSQYERPNRSWTVLYSSVDGKYSCSCLQFESDGVPCAHLFCVLKYRNVSVYPKSLIEDRWTTGGGRLKMVPTAAQCVDEMSGRILRYTTLMCEAKKACHNLSQSTEDFDSGIFQLSRLTKTSMKYREAKRPSVVELVVHPVPDNVLKDPVIARTNGMHRNSVPAANAGNENGGEGNRCGGCGVSVHNKRRCPLVKYTNKGPGKCQKSSKKSKTVISGKSAKPHRSDKSGKPSKSAKTETSENVGEHGYEENVPATSEFEGNEPNQSRNAYTMQRSPSNAADTDTFVGDECHDNVKMADVNSQVGESCQINE